MEVRNRTSLAMDLRTPTTSTMMGLDSLQQDFYCITLSEIRVTPNKTLLPCKAAPETGGLLSVTNTSDIAYKVSVCLTRGVTDNGRIRFITDPELGSKRDLGRPVADGRGERGERKENRRQQDKTGYHISSPERRERNTKTQSNNKTTDS